MPPLMLSLPKIVTGLLQLRQTVAAVMVAVRVAGKAKGVARAGVEGAGNVVPWNGGLKLQIGALQQVVGVVRSGTVLMMTPAVGRSFAT